MSSTSIVAKDGPSGELSLDVACCRLKEAFAVEVKKDAAVIRLKGAGIETEESTSLDSGDDTG